MKKTIVVSAVNLFEGGPLKILKECLSSLSADLADRYRVIALVHDPARLPVLKNIEYRAYRRARASWLFRLYYEYIYFYFVSRRMKPHLWLSLHDITPNVSANVRTVYCHNPSPFCPFSFRLLAASPEVALFSLFYRYLYRINIRRNNYVIVQQEWIRSAFQELYGIRNVVVAYPAAHGALTAPVTTELFIKASFLYPAFPRVFKNLEVVAEAAKLLFEQGRTDFQVLLTITGDENAYARQIVARYRNIPVISFIGIKTAEEIHRLYGKVHALVFSSRLETWGLPISEFKVFRKPMLLPDLPYAHETVGDYDQVKFFDPGDPRQLAGYMKALMDRTLAYDGNRRIEVRQPFAHNWEQLFDILLGTQQGEHG